MFLGKSAADFARVLNPLTRVANLSQLTVAFWVKTKTRRIGTVISYSLPIGEDIVMIGSRGVSAVSDNQIMVRKH